MRKLKVQHEPLPGIGEIFELQTAGGDTMTIVAHRSGRRDVVVGRSDDAAPLTARLTRAEAAAVAALLTGAHIELTTTARG